VADQGPPELFVEFGLGKGDTTALIQGEGMQRGAGDNS
jgi:hypothetical protein